MAINAKSLWIFALVWFQSNTCESKQFCQTFVDNNNEISFVFRTIQYFDYESQSYLFIDDHYWYLDFNQNLMELSIYQTESKRPHHWFGANYSLATCLWRPSEGYCAIGLIDKNQTSIDFRKRILKDHKLKEYIKVAKHTIRFVNNFRPTVAFVVNDGKHENLTWFIQQHRRNDSTFDMSAELYEFDSNLMPKLVHNYQLRDEVNPTAIRQLDPNMEVIGIFRQILSARKSPKRTDEEYGIIILFKLDKVIKYCWTHDKQLSTSCNVENLKTLSDCSAYTKQEFKDSNDNSIVIQTEKSDSFYSRYMDTPLVKVVLILLVIIFIAQMFIDFRGKDENEKQYKLNLIFADDFQKKLIKA